MLKMNLFCITAVAMFVSVLSVCGQSPQTGAEQEKSSVKFVVGAGEALMPQGYFLLIRKGQKIGAVRFINIEQGSKRGTGKASYESYFQDGGSGLFGSLNVRKRTGEINLKPIKGFHPFAFEFGNGKVKIGGWSFASIYPGAINMYPWGKDEKDYGYEFAPTSAQSVEEIDALDKQLKWFRFNADEQVEVPVSELPK